MEASKSKDLKPWRDGDEFISYRRETHWAIAQEKEEYFRKLVVVVGRWKLQQWGWYAEVMGRKYVGFQLGWTLFCIVWQVWYLRVAIQNYPTRRFG